MTQALAEDKSTSEQDQQEENPTSAYQGKYISGVYKVDESPTSFMLASIYPQAADSNPPKPGSFSNGLPGSTNYPRLTPASAEITVSIAPSAKNAKSDPLLGQVSMGIHNLRNALMIVFANTEHIGETLKLSTDTMLSEAISQELSDLENAVKRAVSITTQMNSLIAERKETFNIHPKETFFGEIVIQLHKFYRNRRNVYISSSVGTCFIDAEHIEHVIHNLIGNALKYAPKGNIYANFHIAPNSDLILEIADQGPGLGENQETLFNEYQRGENSTDKPGFGLGLHYCKLVCEKHGGTITAQNSEQGGAIFRITIPQPPTSAQK